MAEIRIRGLAEADREAWLALWNGYNAFYERVGPAALPEAVTRATWARFFDPSEPVHAMVAEDDSGLVGLVHYLFHRTTTSIAPICYLNDLFTTAEARGKGVGGALIEAVYERARRAGSSRVYWQTHETNAVARRLYDQVAAHSGFIIYRIDV